MTVKFFLFIYLISTGFRILPKQELPTLTFEFNERPNYSLATSFVQSLLFFVFEKKKWNACKSYRHQMILQLSVLF